MNERDMTLYTNDNKNFVHVFLFKEKGKVVILIDDYLDIETNEINFESVSNTLKQIKWTTEKSFINEVENKLGV